MAKQLQFRTNSRHIGQLGRELVTDFVTALVELVKNSYDADAKNVQIRIENANTPQSRILVIDTGMAMTQEEFENKWMVIGTSNKVSDPYTPKGRKKTGKKGIGRFSVERLAEKVTIYSYNNEQDFKVFINWNLYEEISIEALRQRVAMLRIREDVSAAKYIAVQIEYYLSLPQIKKDDREIIEACVGNVVHDYTVLFDQDILDKMEEIVIPLMDVQEGIEQKLEEINNPLETIKNRNNEISYKMLTEVGIQEKGSSVNQQTGMVLILENLRDTWRQKDIDKLQKELRLLIAPEFLERDAFHIQLLAEQFETAEELSVDEIMDIAFGELDARIFHDGRESEIVYHDKDGNQKTKLKQHDIPCSCGDVSFKLYYFLRDSVHMQHDTYNYRFALRILDMYCGIKIYRDDFRVKPYGELGNDWLELDKNKVKDTHGYRVGNNQTIGIVRISEKSNPLLIDATNREGIIENQAYEELKEFILECLGVISQLRIEAYESSLPELQREIREKKKKQDEEPNQKAKQEEKFQKTLFLIERGGEIAGVRARLKEWKAEEERRQKEKEEQYERTEAAYKKVVEYQETELSMYKNLATLGILTGNFGHETQDIISRIGNSIFYYEQIVETVKNAYFKDVTRILKTDFARIEGYSMMIVEFLRKRKRNHTEDLNLGMVLNEVSKLYLSMLRQFNIHFSWYSQNDIRFTMRQIDLESIIINMITNAFEQLKWKKERNMEIRFIQEEEDIFLSFEDSGNGIPAEKREEIFNPFVTTKEDGIGLGLNIVRDIVINYGGTIRVMTSEKLGGAKFLIHFIKKEIGA